MKKTAYIYILIVMAAAIFLSACNKTTEEQTAFMETCDGVGLSIGGTMIFTYDAKTCQLGYSEDLKEYRVSDDSMNNFYVLTLAKEPGDVGSAVRGDLTWTTSSDVRQRSGMEFKLLKAQNDIYWFWNKKANIGVAVRHVR